MSRTLLLFLLRGFGTGYTPRVPGTMGSILAFLLMAPVWLQPRAGDGSTAFALPFLLAVISAVMAWWGFQLLHEEWEQFDPSDIVLDEFAGTFLLVALLTFTGDETWYLIGFVSFRLFDTLKPFPVNVVEQTGRFAGLVLDDLVAAVLAAGTTGGLWYVLQGPIF